MKTFQLTDIFINGNQELLDNPVFVFIVKLNNHIGTEEVIMNMVDLFPKTLVFHLN